mmetsp:Transcript_26317/g.56927  ORF Transcript_26317/g.56927 Transcript_26317/m.56927 type:complete len:81 (-) Transcript_26317:152-394(-)
MNNQYLPDFVKGELFLDFGLQSLNVWQLIMHWRKESKEDVGAVYNRLFASWLHDISSKGGEEGLVDISYILKVKAANVRL